MSDAGDKISAQNANWNFKGEVVDKFEEHVSKSVPFYKEGHDLIVKLSDFFVKDDSTCYEIGSSVGTLSYDLAKHHEFRNTRFIGIEIENDMCEKATEKYNAKNLNFVNDDANVFEFEESDFIVCYYALQFVRPSQRQLLVDKIYKSLKWGGAFILFEKVRACDARFQDMMTSLYVDYKLDKGYSPDEIVNKSRSLKGVLEPFSSQANIDILKRSGFVDVMSVMKYVSFEGFLAIK